MAGAGAWLATAASTWWGQAAIQVALAAGASYAANKLMAPDLGSDFNVELQTSGSMVPIRLVYGEATVAGVEAYRNSALVARTKDNFDLHYYLTLTGHEVDDITDCWLDDELLRSGTELDWSTNHVIAGKYYVGPGVDYAVSMWKFLGTSGQTASSELTGAYSADPTIPWTTNHRQRGCAGVVIRYSEYSKSQSLFQQGPPTNARFRVRGYKCYDPRLDSTNGGSGSQRLATPSTWTWTDNPVLCVAHYLCFSEWGPKWDYTWINWATAITEANYCDQTVAIPNGSGGSTTQKRYRCNAVLNAASTDYLRDIQILLASMRGTLTPNGALWEIRSGRYIAPTLTIDESFLRAGPKLSPSVSRIERYNTVKATYVDRDNFDVTNETPLYTDASLLARDNGEQLVRTIDLPSVTDFYQASRMAYVELYLGDQQKTLQFPGNYKCLQVLGGERVNVNLAEWGMAPDIFRCEEMQFGEDGVDLVLRHDTSTAWADPAYTSYFVRNSTGGISGGYTTVPAVTSLTATAGLGCIDLNWTPPDNSSAYDMIRIYASPDSSFANAVLIYYGRNTTFRHNVLVAQWYWAQVERQGTQLSLKLPNSSTSTITATPLTPPQAGATYSATANILNERHGDFENSQACDFRGHQTNFGSSVSLMHLIAGVSYMGRMAMEVYQGDSRGLTYDFGPTALSWTSSNITVSTNSFSVTLTATGTDPQFISPGFSIAGATYYRVLMRLKRLAGSGWDGSLFYATSGGHSFSGSFVKQIADPTSGAGTNWVYAEWRMDALTVGGTDWTTHTITQMRIDLGAGSGDNFEVDYVVIDGANNVNEEWGFNLCGDDTSGGSTAQFKDALVFPAARRWMLIAAFATNTPDVYYPRAELHAALYKAASGGTLLVDRTHPTSLVQPSPFSADPVYQLLAFELDLTGNTTDAIGFLRVYMKLKSGSFGYTVLRLDRCMLIDVTETPQITEANFPTQWVPAGGSYFGDARRRPKPGATTRSATTLLADPHMWNWVGDAVEHRFYGTFYYSAGATPAIKVQLLLNGSLSTFSATIHGNDANGGAVNIVSGNWHTTPIVFAGGAGTGVISFECVFTASGMFTLDFGWAPNGAGNSTLGRASFCTLERTGII